ncbi:hypothetical protein [Chryseobacterium wangxinyae]|uniref:hypothetical protein n=1 Tax=unclassified Chryseobacterium TaxID=2593645 RepID=UPI002270521C|nr:MULTISPECIES: hypothetical protein [unclassified Chryseobacterium]MCY0969677.1 hypothetical protein [Chryseobacterium sp. CY353]MCY0976348.1 hypothetical protein [Chryseobacterium sp. CY350]WBZ94054.1 hypothetical protein PGH12_11280 [Chryseobacterium sp. CY350]
MKHTKEQIIARAKEIMKDLDGKYYFEECVDGAFYDENHKIISGKNEGKSYSMWVIRIIALMDNSDFLTISDETGEPLYYQNFNTFVFDIEKDEKGYFRVGLPRD